MIKTNLKLSHVLKDLISIFGTHVQILLCFLVEAFAHTFYLFSVSLCACGRKLRPLANKRLRVKFVVDIWRDDFDHALDDLLAAVLSQIVDLDELDVGLHRCRELLDVHTARRLLVYEEDVGGRGYSHRGLGDDRLLDRSEGGTSSGSFRRHVALRPTWPKGDPLGARCQCLRCRAAVLQAQFALFLVLAGEFTSCNILRIEKIYISVDSINSSPTSV